MAADWHHFVVGRRGVGKSMLLLNVAKHAADAGRPAVYIDLETLRDNPYPDVLVRLLIELAGELERHLRGFHPPLVTRWKARRRLRALRGRLEVLLRDPQQADYNIADSKSSGRARRLGGRVGVASQTAGVAAQLEGAAERGSAESSAFGREASFARTKLEGLQSEATEFREVLRERSRQPATAVCSSSWTTSTSFVGRTNPTCWHTYSRW